MRTNVYIDGFNFYYGCVKNTPCKWLDFSQLCAHTLKQNEILTIKYFTARIVAPQDDPGQATRQDAYFRALECIPNVEIILGHFLTHEVRRRRADGDGSVMVIDTEEKGSDVNLATHLVHDAHRGLMDCAVLITNDSDLAGPAEIVRDDIGIRVGILSPTTKKGRYPSHQLRKNATFVIPIRKWALENSQFPDPVVTAAGYRIYKPSSW